MKIIPGQTRKYKYWLRQLNACLDQVSGAKALEDKAMCIEIYERCKSIAARLIYMSIQRNGRIARRCNFKVFDGVLAAKEPVYQSPAQGWLNTILDMGFEPYYGNYPKAIIKALIEENLKK